MPATAQQIIDNAYAKSAAARPEQMASPNELLARIGQALREWGQLTARENPYLLGESAEVTFGTVGWARPEDCIRVIDVRTTAGTVISPVPVVGTSITIVPWDDQQIALGSPCLTELGQVFRPTGQSVDPTNGTLQILYARAPQTPQTTTATIDPLFPAWAYDYLQFDLAAYLATKEERTQDEQAFYAGKNATLQMLVEWMRAQTYTLVQRWPVVTPPLTNVAGGRQQPVGGG